MAKIQQIEYSYLGGHGADELIIVKQVQYKYTGKIKTHTKRMPQGFNLGFFYKLYLYSYRIPIGAYLELEAYTSNIGLLLRRLFDLSVEEIELLMVLISLGVE